MTEDERNAEFAEELCGITPKEVLGLLALIMKRENQVYSNATGQKRVRRFSAKLIGIVVNLTEVNSHYINRNQMDNISRMFGSGGRQFDPFAMPVDYHVETDEWEFKVNIDSTNQADAPNLFFGGIKVKVRRPWFEGDETDYKHKMSMIRLMGLGSVSADDIFV